MKLLTIHYIKYLLKKALGLESDVKETRRKDFSEFLGVWDKNDLNSFKKATADFNSTNAEIISYDKHFTSIEGLHIWNY